MSVLDVVLLVAAGGVAVPVGVILLETVAALWGRGGVRERSAGPSGLTETRDGHRGLTATATTSLGPSGPTAARAGANEGLANAKAGGANEGLAAMIEGQAGRVAVLVPAHDEEAVIGRTLAGIRGQLGVGDRLVVVADNCTDQTAAVAREAGAEVIERCDREHRGKGYALAAGVEYLRSTDAGSRQEPAGPDVVVVMDADTIPEEGAIASLTAAVSQLQTPVQGIYLMEVPAGASMRTRLSAFAFAYKNLVRALGAGKLGVPCCLRGTGMAFPWRALEGAKLATGNLVEDMQLGVDLAISGFVPRLCREARVMGVLPEKTAANKVQRTRWEQGHMQTILRNVPRLLAEGIRQRRPALWLMALDLAVPPLALVMLAWCMLAAVAGLAAGIGWASWVPPLAVLAIGGAMAGSILAAWAGFARQMVPWPTLLAVPFYVMWKIPVYVGFLVRREKAWIRTERSA